MEISFNQYLSKYMIYYNISFQVAVWSLGQERLQGVLPLFQKPMYICAHYSAFLRSNEQLRNHSFLLLTLACF